MKKSRAINPQAVYNQTHNLNKNRLAVRTNLRAGLSLNEIGDQASSLWNQLTSAVSNAVNSATGSATNTTGSTST